MSNVKRILQLLPTCDGAHKEKLGSLKTKRCTHSAEIRVQFRAEYKINRAMTHIQKGESMSDLTVAGALVALKLSQAKIDKATNTTTFVTSIMGNRPPTGYATLEEFGANAKAQLQSARDLIEYRNKLKSAIVRSNAVTTVQVGSTAMTVAEAIERKTSIVYDKQLLLALLRQLEASVRQTDQVNAQVQQRLDSIITASVSKDSKTSADEVEAISKPFLERNGAKLHDPLNVKKQIEDLQKSIEEFEANVDLALSASNAVTIVTL